jgi:hypothetical protein
MTMLLAGAFAAGSMTLLAQGDGGLQARRQLAEAAAGCTSG